MNGLVRVYYFPFIAPQLEEEVRRLGNLTEEREKHCRCATKALELLPSECIYGLSVRL